MTRYVPLWLQSGSYAASVDRRLVGALWPSARVDGMAVTVASGTTVNVAVGNAAVPTPNNTGSSLCVSDAVEQVALPAAPAAGLNRIDVVIVRPRGTDLDGGVNNDWIFDYVTGAEAATAVVPATPAGTAALANVTRPGGQAAIVAGNIADVRPAAGLSTPTPPPPVTTGGLVSWTDPGGTVWVAKPGVNGGAYRRATDVLHARWYRTAAYNIPITSGIAFPFDTKDYDAYGLYNAANGTFTAPVAGMWRFSSSIQATANSGTDFHNAMLRKNNVRVRQHQGIAGGTSGTYGMYAVISTDDLAAAGDNYIIESYKLGAVAAALGGQQTGWCIGYIGSGQGG
jgi:hypothetical protein